MQASLLELVESFGIGTWRAAPSLSQILGHACQIRAMLRRLLGDSYCTLKALTLCQMFIA